MRRTLVLGSALLASALLTTGCHAAVQHAGGPAGPVTAAPTVTPVPSPPASATPSPPAATHTRATPPTTKHTLGPYGYGALKLGMTATQANATGLIVPWHKCGGTDCNYATHLRASGGSGPVTKATGDDGDVIFTLAPTVLSIDTFPGVNTPEGIHLGSTHAAVLAAYPDWTAVGSGQKTGDGLGIVKAPGNPTGLYEIGIVRGKVVSITLESSHS